MTAPPVVVGDSSLSWDELRPFLAEAAGGVVIEEMILDHQVRGEMERQGLKVSDTEISGEKDLLIQSLQRGAGAAPEQSARLVLRLQQTRGLGPVRFRALLERNAMLRRLVRDSVEVDPAAVQRELAVRFGDRVKCRIIVVPSSADAARVMARLKEAGPDLPERFAAEAKLVSVDPSAASGGQVAPISTEDLSYAVAVRNAARDLNEGEMSPIIVLENGCAILLGEGKAASVDPPAAARAEVEAELRLRQERIAMDRLAQRLLNSAPVTVFDPSLGWSWKMRVVK